ncbi:response regulator [Amaricoccus tamworthensis]|uniref:response regulator n=1 Tax=Amaricoccus tamworthensis TaxID=57002 RepID=UPI003C7CC151
MARDFFSTPHVIIADDERGLLTMMGEFCREQGWSVETCVDGNELVDAVMAGTAPALLLIDIMMPELDGIEVIDRIHHQDRPLRVRFMSGGVEAQIRAANLIATAKNMNVGANIKKPITTEKLQAILDEEERVVDGLAGLRQRRAMP